MRWIRPGRGQRRRLAQPQYGRQSVIHATRCDVSVGVCAEYFDPELDEAVDQPSRPLTGGNGGHPSEEQWVMSDDQVGLPLDRLGQLRGLAALQQTHRIGQRHQ